MQYSRLIIADRIFAWFSLILILISWAIAIWAWPDLPIRIPTHFGPTGYPDAFGQKTFWSVFLLPTLQLVVAGILWWAYRYPQYSNIPSTIAISALPEPTRSLMYRLLRRMIVVISVVINLVLAHSILAIVSVGFGASNRLNPLMLWSLIGLLLFIVIRYTVLTYRLAKNVHPPLSSSELNEGTRQN